MKSTAEDCMSMHDNTNTRNFMNNTMFKNMMSSPDYYNDFGNRRSYNELSDAYDEQLNRIADLECRLAELEEQLKQSRH